jgi:hypothetical protein
MSPDRPRSLRRRYVNDAYPLIVLRFEDGHEIRVERGGGRSFNAYEGERIHVIAIYDRTSDERVVVETRRAEEFPLEP